MHETEFHSIARRRLFDALEDYFADSPDVYLATRMSLYYREGERWRHRDPDALVARGVAKHPRHSYRLLEEKVVLCVLFEIASRGTWRVDLHEKPALYAGLGVKEYFLYDSEGCYLKPVLRGFRMVKGRAVPMRLAADGTLISKQLGLRLAPEGIMLRLIDLSSGEPIPTKLERIEIARQSRLRAEQDYQRARQRRLCAEQDYQRAVQERRDAEQRRLNAEAALYAGKLEVEVRRLRLQVEQEQGAAAEPTALTRVSDSQRAGPVVLPPSSRGTSPACSASPTRANLRRLPGNVGIAASPGRNGPRGRRETPLES
jgi:Uma2 family endonuclease